MSRTRKLGPGARGPRWQPRRTSDTPQTLRTAVAHPVTAPPVSVSERSLTPCQREQRSMVRRTPTDAEIAALIATRTDVERTGGGIVAGVIDDDGRREAVA